MSNIFEYFELIQNIEINFISFCKAFTIPIVKFVMGIIFIYSGVEKCVSRHKKSINSLSC